MSDIVPVIETVINGKWVLNLPAHRAARPEWPTWEYERLHSMSLNIGPGDYVWDIGSEEGDLSALVQFWIGHNGSMVLMEPNPLVWPNIKLIWEANNLKPPVFCWVGFAGNEDRGWTEPLTDEPYTWPECADGPVIGDHGFCQLNERPDIPSVRLDTLREWIGAPSIITLDCEGSELEILKGAAAILVENKPLVFCSIHPEFMREQYDYDPNELYQLMADLGYREKFLAKDHEIHVAFFHPHGRELRM